MKAKESIRLWFDYLKQDGEFTDIVILKNDEAHYFPHGEVDGIGAFLQLQEKTDQVNVKTKMRKLEPWYRFLWGFFMYSKRLPFRSASWKKFDSNWRSHYFGKEPLARAVLYLNKEQTTKIKELARNEGVTLNSYLLFNLDHTIKPLLNPKQKRVWLIPVSTRVSKDQDNYQNSVGFTDGYMYPEITLSAIDTQIKKRIKSFEHLGGVVGVSLGVVLGRFLLKGLVHLNKFLQVRTGVFTNLGEGELEGNTDKFVGFAPVIETQPVGAMCGIWNQEMVLSMHFHHCLGLSSEDAKEYLSRWLTLLLRD